MPHYRATEDRYAVIEGDGLLLIDSGGAIPGRHDRHHARVPIGTITAAHKRDFTLVLKGMIALSRRALPARHAGRRCWTRSRARRSGQPGCDYGHGTGHGVGYFLNVHEGPQTISPRRAEPHTAMEPGMITSNEPGIYRPGQWGMRIENLVLNVPWNAGDGQFGEFLGFETLTLCPIDTRCIDMALMRADEVAWLNDYHAEVRARLAPQVTGDARDWLESAHGRSVAQAISTKPSPPRCLDALP